MIEGAGEDRRTAAARALRVAAGALASALEAIPAAGLEASIQMGKPDQATGKVAVTVDIWQKVRW